MENVMKIGIDLGTTNTVVSYVKSDGRYEYVKFGGKPICPSVLYIQDSNNIVVGNKAVKYATSKPKKIIKSAKTHMGENSFVYPTSADGLDFDIRLTPTDVATYVLKEVKKAVSRLPEAEDSTIEAIITVPAYFSTNQTGETYKAGVDAGFKVKRIITEPVSAAVGYVTENIEDDARIFVVDFGGGTLDLTILKYSKSTQEYTTEFLDGDNRLGGDNIDQCIVNYFKSIILDDINLDLTDLKSSGLSYDEYWEAISKLNDEAIRCKLALSDDEDFDVEVPDIFPLPNGDMYTFELYITREEFEEQCQPVFSRLENLINKLIRESNISINDISRILLVGGSCFIPKVKEIVESIFDREVYIDGDLSKIVALGACIVANQDLNALNLTENISHDFGVEVSGNKFSTIIARNTPVPCKQVKRYAPVVDNQESIQVNVYERSASINANDNDINKCEFFGSIDFSDFQKGKKEDVRVDIEFSFDVSRKLTVNITNVQTGKVTTIALDKKSKPIMHNATKPMDIFLLIDSSGSMHGTPLEEVKSASNKLISDMIDLSIHRMGIIKFDDLHSEVMVSKLTSNRKDLINSLDRIYTGGCTYIANAFRLAVKNLNNDKRVPIIIMLTDGEAHDPEATIEVTKQAKAKGIRIITIGAGKGFNKKFLTKISSNKNGIVDTYKIDNMSQLVETFENIMVSLQEV